MRYCVVIRTIRQRYLPRCLQSVQEQGILNFAGYVWFDGEAEPCDDFEDYSFFCDDDDRFDFRYDENHVGVAANLSRAVADLRDEWTRDGKPEWIVSILDGDDMLPPKALWRVQRVYEKYPDTLITYGSYIKMSKGRKTKISQPYPDDADVRKYPWRGSHLKTFRASLLPHIREEWFKDEKGNWLQAASDLALMIPLMELAGLDRCRHISRPTYIWRDNTPWKTNRELQKRCEAIVRAKPREKRLP